MCTGVGRTAANHDPRLIDASDAPFKIAKMQPSAKNDIDREKRASGWAWLSMSEREREIRVPTFSNQLQWAVYINSWTAKSK